MAINLRKEAYHKEQSSENTAQAPPIREVFPTYDDTPYNMGNVGEDGEIYPVREIYPKPPPINIVTEEETAVEAPEENLPCTTKRKRYAKKQLSSVR